MSRASRNALTATVILAPLLIVLALWAWTLGGKQILDSKLAAYAPWPAACSTRGCVTTRAWHRHHQTRLTFAQASRRPPPSEAETLTTLLRQHLVENAWLRTPVTIKDAARYREEVLGLTREELAKKTTGYALEEYDRLVILPLLQQEALKQQNSVESDTELYQWLARERAIVVLPWRLKWDKQQAAVVAR